LTAAVAAALSMFTLAAIAAPAWSADTITSNLSCCSFTAGPFSQDLGENPTYENPTGADAPHNVTSVAKGPDGGPLFASTTIAPGSTALVGGTQYLAGGTYPFFCTLHGQSMSGDLFIDGGKGEVVPRPRIQVTIPSQRLKTVRRAGKVKVRVSAVSDAGGLNFRVSRGGKLIGFAGSGALSAGSSRTVSVPLSKAGRKSIRTGRSVKLQVKASVRFGSPRSASRTLR
jgi:plastocyanin